MERIQFLKIAAAAHNETVEQAAIRFGCKSQYLYRWVNGLSFSKPTEEKLLEYIQQGLDIIKKAGDIEAASLTTGPNTTSGADE
jgi:hypothetical protein